MAAKDYEEVDLLTDVPVLRILTSGTVTPVARLGIKADYVKADGSKDSINVFVNLSKRHVRALRMFVETLGES